MDHFKRKQSLNGGSPVFLISVKENEEKLFLLNFTMHDDRK